MARRETWNAIVKDVIVDRGSICHYCFEKKSTQGAHALVHKRVYNKTKKHKLINVRENFMPCCDDCAAYSETYAGRRYAWGVLCGLYGESVIKAWYDGLNLKIPEILD